MRHPKLTWLLCSLAVLSLARCECDPELQRVAPKIEIADPFDASKSVCAEAGIRGCEYDFGEVPIGQGRFFKFLIKNPSPVDLVIDEITFAQGSDPAFSVSGEPPAVVFATAGSEGEEVTISFIPQVAADVTATLVISSDAANLEPDEDVVITLRGTGVDLGQPELVITPEVCDFGQVGVGVTSFCDITLENLGQRDLQIPSVGFSPDTPLNVFGAASVIAVPVFIAPGTGVSVRLYATPDSVDGSSGTFTLTSNDPDRPSAEVPLLVEGAQAPTAVARVLSINGNTVNDPSPQVQPLDDVVLTGQDSVAASANGSIVSYHWEWVSKPAESSLELTTPDQMTTQFFFSSAAGEVRGIDVAGTFVVRLTVTDDLGQTSTNDARVTLNAIPSEALHVQLTWDASVNDIDFHLKKGANADYCGTTGCYFGNCKASSGSYPEWDGVSGRTAGDPTLDVDDLSGYGPENINIDAPVDDIYTVGVHFWGGTLSTFATVKIFVNGALREEYSRELVSSDDFWEVAQVQWANGGAIVIPVDDYWSNSSCPHRGP